MLKIRLHQLKSIALIWFFSVIAAFLPKKAWVICERGYDARDNGYVFYRFMKQTHPEIELYYLIDKNSADYKKVAEDAVQYGSLKNYWVLARAKRIVSSHYATCLPHESSKVFVFCGLHKKFFFLQHGIIYNDLPGLHKDNAPMKLFICGAKPEYEYVKEHFGHEASVVQYTGLARYDNLMDCRVKKQILLMPTWRAYIKNEDDFLQSDYYKHFQTFINDQRVIACLKSHGYSLLFYPHYEMQKYLKLFSNESDCVTLASFDEYDVQTLLKESALLITDYSSVFFDFAYMKKPMIYFQFDKEAFYDKHYKRGYFDYDTMGFGATCEDYEQLVAEFCEIAENKFEVPECYANRVDSFFVMRDNKNCQRIYEEIVRG